MLARSGKIQLAPRGRRNFQRGPRGFVYFSCRNDLAEKYRLRAPAEGKQAELTQRGYRVQPYVIGIII